MGGGFFTTVFMTLAFAFALGLAALPAGAAAVLGLVAAGFLAASAAGLSGGVWGAGTS